MRKDLRKVRCCFSGHRPEKIHYLSEEEIRKRLRAEIERAIGDGYVTFISGMARGVDIWAAEIVLEIREQNPKIHLVCACPFPGFQRKWSQDWQDRFENIICRSDLVRYVVTGPPWRRVYKRRDEWMVRHSSRLIAYWEGHPGTGTFFTIVCADCMGLEVFNIRDNQV